ncbi:S-adenosyl-L-methionine-dependent methyltransferase [Endogone sp. FLAS-F59071]|nr:S-adenosyl-L-methionine-dependent methyltransferase [Endogone sp. FLAS-F59071]|eukprot:RUS18869.1 S-adenosyl-L-methionine-dependent methyltransferase [Endogone sp. FLAS-F59071]
MGNVKSKYLVKYTISAAGDRMDLLHSLVRDLVHGNFQAPVEEGLQKGIKVLDAGCGVGKWTLEMARDYPFSQFTGTDISRLFPKSTNLSNCNFVLADTRKVLPFPDNTFDYVYQRFLTLSFTRKEWENVFNELVRVTKPGGWIECFEYDFELHRPGPRSKQILAELGKLKEVQVFGSERLDRFANFLENVQRDDIMLSYGWNGKIGDALAYGWQLQMLAMKTRLTAQTDWSEDEFELLVSQALAEFPEQRTWGKMPYVYGQKPALKSVDG